MTVTPSGILSLPLDHGRTLLANASAWQSWVDADDATEAKGHIHLGATPPPADGSAYTEQELLHLWPLAVIAHPPDGAGLRVMREGDGADLFFTERGRLLLMLEDRVDPAYTDDPGNAELAFLNNVGDVLDDMAALAGTDDGTNQYLWASSFNVLEGPIREAFGEQGSIGRYHWIGLEINWGFGNG